MARDRTWTDEQLVEAVALSTSMGQTLDRLSLNRTGGNYTHIKKHITAKGLSTEHWLGKGHNKGKSWTKNDRLPLEQLAAGSGLRRRVLKDKLLPYHCKLCSLDEWQGNPISLRLDHINGVYNDNRLENLRWLCPNCDSQTPTFAGRNRKRI